jgi:hypothetical protein
MPFDEGGRTLHSDKRSGVLKRTPILIVLAVISIACTASSVDIPDVSGSPSAADEEGPASKFDPPSGAVSLSPGNCPAAAAHVYHPGRLWLLHGCQTTTLRGTVEYKKAEPDGDYHVRLKLDIGQSCYGQACINTQNVQQQHSDLVLEPVCEKEVTQADAVSACQGYHNDLAVPRVGTHVEVTGYWVFDDQHGWNELHPLTAIRQL